MDRLPTVLDTLSVNLETNTARRGGLTIKLTPGQAVILHTLAERFPKIATQATLYRALYGSSQKSDIKTIRVAMTQLRKFLPVLKIEVHTIHNVGYMLALEPVTSEVTA